MASSNVIRTLLIANRGEIARRIIRTSRRMGIRAVAVYSDADANSPHVVEASAAVRIGPAPAADSYLNIPTLIAAAQRAGAQAIHPGYGFLAENAAFARACAEAGLVFVGPPPAAIEAMGDKRAARQLATQLGLPVIPGYDGRDQDEAALAREAARIGYPVMIKAAAGGGGKGMRLVMRPDDLAEALAGARREAAAAFGSGDLLLERALLRPRHVEVQVFADSHGRVVHLGERECTVQRRHQKVIEESPSPVVGPGLRAEMGAAAVAIAATIGYSGAGTVEFLLDEDGRFYFLEMNTRLQVEHPVTELVTGLDLVEWQIRVAQGESLPWSQDEIAFHGHALEARLYAEDPANGFLPVTGNVLLWQPAEAVGVRVDDGIVTGNVVASHYDPLLAKIIAHGPRRAEALHRLSAALAETTLLGLTTNLPYLRAIVDHPVFVDASALSTRFLEESLPGWRPDFPPEEVAVVLAAVSLARWSRGNTTGPGYWRNNPGDPAPFRYRIGEETREVRLRPVPWQPGQFTVAFAPNQSPRPLASVGQDSFLPAQAEHKLPPVGQDSFLPYELVLDGVRRRGVLANRGDEWWAQTAAGPLRLTTLPLLPEPRRHAGAGGSLRAPLHGTVLAVLVVAGQRVDEGQPLVKIEAMKMEHTVRTAAAGVVEAVYYAPGDTVEADALLVKIREASDERRTTSDE